jgi:hypothetical protein
MDLNLLTKIISGRQGRKPTEMKQWYKSNSKKSGSFQPGTRILFFGK